jgi:uncharacterized protein
MIELTRHPRGIILTVRARAGARRNEIGGEHNGMLRIAVTAVPEKGKANRAIVELLSDTLDVPKSSIELLSGGTSPEKRFLIAGVDTEHVSRRLASLR